MGQASKRLPASLRLHLFIMSSGGDLCMGHEILFGALSFIINDLAWLQDAPLDVEALPSRGATHFRASACGVLLLQQSPPMSILAPVMRSNKRPRRPQLQRWVRHAQARQNASSQVAVLESVVVAPPSQCLNSVPEVALEMPWVGSAASSHGQFHESPAKLVERARSTSLPAPCIAVTRSMDSPDQRGCSAAVLNLLLPR
ncbi:hypothetical protein ZWY2020_024039 [Hordeum vulgare]|nr:hypothetical protein ZWY2020_024039 [Hordeum vulgare]